MLARRHRWPVSAGEPAVSARRPTPCRGFPALADEPGHTGSRRATVRDSYDRWLEASARPAGGSAWAVGCGSGWKGRTRAGQSICRSYAPDRIDGQRDHIGIATEADAFARLIASCDLTPPFAIALFGDWGSGKSFLMSAVQDRIAALTERVADRPQSETQGMEANQADRLQRLGVRPGQPLGELA